MKIFATAALLALAPFAALAEGKTHHIAIHVDQADPAALNLALNNAQNLTSYYKDKGDEVVIEMVTYGPGLTMLTEDSPVKDRVEMMALEMDHLTFAACANTLKGMEKKAGHAIPLLAEAKVVPSGVARLIDLQEEGYSYVRP